MESLFFITGHRKSGTTMFSNLFDGHSCLCNYPTDLGLLYAYFPYYISENMSEIKCRKRLEILVFDSVEKIYLDSKTQFNLENWKSIFNSMTVGNDIKNIEVVLKSLFSAWRIFQGAEKSTPLVVKETSADIYASEIFEWFPQVKFLHLVRDPRDNFAALKAGVRKYYNQLGEDELKTLASLLHRGLTDMKMGKINQEIYGPEKYLTIRFEDVVLDTKNTMLRVAEFLDIQFEETLLTPTILGKITRGNNYDGKDMFSISKSNISRWQKRITSDEAQVIEFAFKGVMEYFGYIPQFSEKEQAKAFSNFYKWSNYQYFFNDPFRD